MDKNTLNQHGPDPKNERAQSLTDAAGCMGFSKCNDGKLRRVSLHDSIALKIDEEYEVITVYFELELSGQCEIVSTFKTAGKFKEWLDLTDSHS